MDNCVYIYMANILKRKVLRVGDALGITIPKSVVDTYGLVRGEYIYIITDGLDTDGFLVIDLGKRNLEEIKNLLKIGQR